MSNDVAHTGRCMSSDCLCFRAGLDTATTITGSVIVARIATLEADNERLREALRQACVDGWADVDGAMRHYIDAASRILEGKGE